MVRYGIISLCVVIVTLTVPVWGVSAANKNAAVTNTLFVMFFGDLTTDCNGDDGGTAYLDECNVCVSGNSGKNPCRLLNDTGITWSGFYPTGNNSTCTGEDITYQDCAQGLDFSNNDDADGHAGFSFVKLASDGSPLPADAVTWSCVKDIVTGLTWEVKTDDEGLHDKDDLYNWYSTDSASNGGNYPWSADDDGDICYGYNAGDPNALCNTQSFVYRVNQTGLCGKSDWRMPSHQELVGIVSFDRVEPSIDLAYFPNTLNSLIWTGVPRIVEGNWAAWYVSVLTGISASNGRKHTYGIRLVRND